MRTKHFIIPFVILFFVPISFVNAEPISINKIDCPTKLVAGERSNISFHLRNTIGDDLLVSDAILLMDYIGTGAENRTEIPITSIDDYFLFSASSETSIEETISFTSEGIHHVDLEIKYSGLDGNDENIILEEICRVKALPFEKDANPVVLTIIISIITTSFGGVTAYFIKRHFINKDTEYQKSIDHQHWLLQQMHSHASKHYGPLAKESWVAEQTIGIASQSKKQTDIDIAFDSLNVFLKKYIDFKNETGANFLFRERDWENQAIRTMQSILLSLPYDKKDVDTITCYLALKQSAIGLPTSGELAIAFKKLKTYFKDWIESEHCKESLKMTMAKLFRFGSILDRQGELISHPDLIKKHYDLPQQKEEQDKFWILYSSVKYVKKGETVFVFGRGLDDLDNVSYQFFLGAHELHNIGERKDNVVQLQLPTELPPGAYDIYAKFSASDGSFTGTTIGIVFHVIG